MSKKITVFGTRGIPDVLGGVETHCQNLYPAIKQQFDVDICVIARSPYVNYKRSSYKKVETYALWAPKKRSLEAIVHSVLATFRTCIDRSDIVHVHAIGPGLVIPLLRLLGKRVVFTHHTTLSRFGLEAKNYLVVVGRFVEEKGMHDAISAYQQSGLQLPLVLIGDADHPTEYSIRLKQLAADTPGVVMTGFLRGDELQAVFSQAKLFVMPSYHEGLPIALLEAMSFSLPAVVSDIPANLEVKLPPDAYFKVGNLTNLAEKMAVWAAANSVDYSVYLQNYNWHEIARKTVNVYHSIDKDIG